MHGVRVAEEVVQVAEDFLVRADQEHAEVVRLAVERVQRQRALHVAAIDELVDLAVRVAGDVAEHGVPRRRLVQPVDRHHREQLLDRPGVRDRLEQREVAEVRVRRAMSSRPCRSSGTSSICWHELAQLAADRPVQRLGLAALPERQVAAIEQVERHVERLLRVVIALDVLAPRWAEVARTASCRRRDGRRAPASIPRARGREPVRRRRVPQRSATGSRRSTRQDKDLRDAIAKTRQLIADLDELIATQFRATFAQLELAFDARFQQLFGGGFAKLVLTDPTDLSATGIEITARPPGKKPQALSMLSGGERALTAVALLFAMLEVRPAPFCVLDEVDAALDEANVGRFTDALQPRRQTQFIVITHNRGTIEAADALYGVTVGDDSVSRVIASASTRRRPSPTPANPRSERSSPAAPADPEVLLRFFRRGPSEPQDPEAEAPDAVTPEIGAPETSDDLIGEEWRRISGPRGPRGARGSKTNRTK